MNSLYDNIRVDQVIESVAMTVTTLTSKYVDMANAIRALFVFHFGAYTTGPTTFSNLRLVQATDASGTGAKAINRFTGTETWIDPTTNLNTGASASPTTLDVENGRKAALEVNGINLDSANSFRYVAAIITATTVTGTGLTVNCVCVRQMKFLHALLNSANIANIKKV